MVLPGSNYRDCRFQLPFVALIEESVPTVIYETVLLVYLEQCGVQV